MRFLFNAHSGNRYLALLALLLLAVVSGVRLATRAGPARFPRILGGVAVGLLDVQMLLGVALALSGMWHPGVAHHLAGVVPALIVAHGANSVARKRPAHADGWRLGGALLALVLIFVGISLLGRGLFQHSRI